MNKKNKYFKRTIVSLLAVAALAIPSASFAKACSIKPVAGYAYIAGCGTNVNINGIIDEIKDNLGNINVICPPQADTENDGETINPDVSLPETDVENNNGGSGDNNVNNGNNENLEGVSEYERRVVELVNEKRAENGLAALTLNAELSSVARLKSQDMKDKGYFSHTSPTYGSPFDMLKQFGIRYRTAGENIARGQRTPEAVVEGWMNSEGHRANILNAQYTQIGVGYVAEGNYWTQLFIG